MPMNDGGKTLVFVDSQNNLKILMMIFLVLSIILFIISQTKQAMRAYFLLIRSLQLIMHLPLYQIKFPANFMTFIQILIPTLNFDILETWLDWENFNIIKFDFEGLKLFSQTKMYYQMIEIGYEMPTSLILLNTVAIVSLLYVIKIVVLSIVTIYQKVTKRESFGLRLQQSLIK